MSARSRSLACTRTLHGQELDNLQSMQVCAFRKLYLLGLPKALRLTGSTLSLEEWLNLSNSLTGQGP